MSDETRKTIRIASAVLLVLWTVLMIRTMGGGLPPIEELKIIPFWDQVGILMAAIVIPAVLGGGIAR